MATKIVEVRRNPLHHGLCLVLDALKVKNKLRNNTTCPEDRKVARWLERAEELAKTDRKVQDALDVFWQAVRAANQPKSSLYKWLGLDGTVEENTRERLVRFAFGHMTKKLGLLMLDMTPDERKRFIQAAEELARQIAESRN